MDCNTKILKLKACTKCGEEKEFTSDFFIKSSKEKHGLAGVCKTCKKRESLEYRRKKGAVAKKPLTFGDVKKYVENIGESSLISHLSDEEIIKTIDKLTFKCKCGNEFERSFNKFKDSKRYICSKCANAIAFDKQRKTRAEFVEALRRVRGGEFELIGEYINYHKITGVRHVLCGRVFDSCSNRLLHQKQGCPLCRDDNRWKNRQKTHDEFLSEFENCMGEEYELLSEYTGCNDELVVFHKECGEVYKTTADSILQGTKCNKPNCISKRISEAKTLTHEDYLKGFKSPLEEEYLILSEYKNSGTPIQVTHTKCGSKWLVNPSRFRNGSRCPRCKESKGEKAISNYLDLSFLNYIPQYKIDECRDERRLPFDFAVFDDEGIIQLLIEFDGEQHFEPIDYFGGESKYLKTKRRDEIKSEYCMKNNIPLLRIPYWDFDNIESILEKELKKYKLLKSAN